MEYSHCTIPAHVSDAMPMLCERGNRHGHDVAVQSVHDQDQADSEWFVRLGQTNFGRGLTTYAANITARLRPVGY